MSTHVRLANRNSQQLVRLAYRNGANEGAHDDDDPRWLNADQGLGSSSTARPREPKALES
jgi:hypothetical protein